MFTQHEFFFTATVLGKCQIGDLTSAAKIKAVIGRNVKAEHLKSEKNEVLLSLNVLVTDGMSWLLKECKKCAFSAQSATQG